MHLEQVELTHSGLLAWSERLRLDGEDGQEDELDDVAAGRLQPPTRNPVPGNLKEDNKGDSELEKEDEAGD